MSARIIPIRSAEQKALEDSVRVVGQARRVERDAVVRWLLTNGHDDAARGISEGEHVK